jgi:hypothetical protein
VHLNGIIQCDVYTACGAFAEPRRGSCVRSSTFTGLRPDYVHDMPALPCERSRRAQESQQIVRRLKGALIALRASGRFLPQSSLGGDGIRDPKMVLVRGSIIVTDRSG